MATTKTTSTKKKAAPKKKISADDIRNRAQQIYQERLNKDQHGDELSDWLSAEQDLMRKG